MGEGVGPNPIRPEHVWLLKGSQTQLERRSKKMDKGMQIFLSILIVVCLAMFCYCMYLIGQN